MNATAPTAADMPVLRTTTNPAHAGRAEALRLVAAHYGMTAYADSLDFDHSVRFVADSPAPQAFKDAFFQTLAALTSALDG